MPVPVSDGLNNLSLGKAHLNTDRSKIKGQQTKHRILVIIHLGKNLLRMLLVCCVIGRVSEMQPIPLILVKMEISSLSPFTEGDGKDTELG